MPLVLNEALSNLRPSGIRRFSALAQATPGCISLTLGEPGEDTPADVCAKVGEGLAAGETHYPPNNGMPALREAISEHMGRRGVAFEPDEVVVTSGATEALFAALQAMLNPEDEVIVPMPAFLLYESIVTLCRARVVPLDTSGAGYQIEADALAAAVTPRTKAIVITSPNNPTGCVLSAESLDAVAELAAERDFYVICDDVYDQLVYVDGYQGFAQRHPELRDRTVVVNSFSKPYAMTGWRLGWLAADAPLVAEIAKVHQYAVSSAVAFTQRAAAFALSTDVSVFRERYRTRCDLVVRALSATGLPTPEPAGAFYAFPSIEEFGLSSEEFCVRAIEEAGVALVPGSLFGGGGHVRLSYACSDEDLEEALARLGRFVGELRRG